MKTIRIINLIVDLMVYIFFILYTKYDKSIVVLPIIGLAALSIWIVFLIIKVLSKCSESNKMSLISLLCLNFMITYGIISTCFIDKTQFLFKEVCIVLGFMCLIFANFGGKESEDESQNLHDK